MTEHTVPVQIIITLHGVTHQTTVNTYGSFQVLFEAIQQATGLGRDSDIPKDMFISTKRVEVATYYGGVQ